MGDSEKGSQSFRSQGLLSAPGEAVSGVLSARARPQMRVHAGISQPVFLETFLKIQ